MEGNKIMNSNKHIGTFETCAFCLRYIQSGEHFGNTEAYTVTTRKLHRQSIARKLRPSRDEIMKDLGLVKVRGALGGIYYE